MGISICCIGPNGRNAARNVDSETELSMPPMYRARREVGACDMMRSNCPRAGIKRRSDEQDRLDLHAGNNCM